jgi:hypothetical protein
VIVDGGAVKEIRKLSPTSFSISITPDENTKNVLVQIEADKIEDLAGNQNENASNEINVKIKVAGLNGLIDKVVDSAPVCDYDTDGKLITEDEETGTTINTEGCKESNTDEIKNDESKYATYNSKLGCYGNTKPLPEGIAENQRCNHPENPNNPNSPCSSKNQAAYREQLLTYQRQAENDRYFGYGFGSALAPINPCTNATIAAKTQNAALKQHQEEKQSGGGGGGGGLGDMLGKIMQGLGGGGMFGGQNDGGGSGVGDGGGNSEVTTTTDVPCKDNRDHTECVPLNTDTAQPKTSPQDDQQTPDNPSSTFTPKDGTIKKKVTRDECKYIDFGNGKLIENPDKTVFQMIDLSGKIYVLLYNETGLDLAANKSLTVDALSSRSSARNVGSCTIYKPNSLKQKSNTKQLICCRNINGITQECIGKKILIGSTYESILSQEFTSNTCGAR